VVAVDVAETLVRLADERRPADVPLERIRFVVGDMLEPSLGRFDHIVAMDSLIHYRAHDMVAALAGLARRSEGSLIATFAPRTPLLAAMHAVGQLFPRSDRSPAIEPIGERRLADALSHAVGREGLAVGRGHRVSRGFYISQALEVVRS
jgi:magnesium-protoporphyrin O-methyltransferase